MEVNSCVICDARAFSSVVVAGEVVAVCDDCFSSSKGFGQGPKAIPCLHLLAMECEEVLPSRNVRSSRQRRAASKMAAGFDRSSYRLACACSTCSKWQSDVDLGANAPIDPPVDVFVINGVSVYTDLEFEVRGRGFESVAEAAQRLIANRDQTIYPGVIPGGLADVARARAPRTSADWERMKRFGRYGASSCVVDPDFDGEAL